MTTPFDLSDRLVDDYARLDPLQATALGLPGHDHLWGDLGPDGEAKRAELARRYRSELAEHVDHADPVQRRTVQVVGGILDEQIEAYEAGDHFEDLRHMASRFQSLSMVFDMMDTSSGAAWDSICIRLETLDEALDGYRDLLEAGRQTGKTVAARQVRSVVEQGRALAGETSAFANLVAKAERTGHGVVVDRLGAAIRHAKWAVAEFTSYLDSTYLPAARATDAAGEDRYRRAASRLVGIDVDPHEAYAWGWAELASLIAEAEAVGREILPGASFAEVTSLLETDPARAAASPEAFVEFIQVRLDGARSELTGTHFDVAAEIEPLTVNLAPPGGPLGAYYLPPSEDFTRPGGVWYSMGDQTVFPLYHHVSTAYHEGFPGHHLQIGTAMVNADRISRAHRLMVWYPGFGEGWALYAERLMLELGYFERPDYVFGMLAKQLYRATRVVVDIGLHLGLTIPAGAPMWAGEAWSFELATEYLRTYGFRTPDQAVSETMRYLGWPGQAIAYKLGEREILSIRAEAERRRGVAFDLKAFHDQIIGNGAMRLDLLREVVLQG